ncbi:MAG: O-antigen ligase family protein [bacterium]|nr:O-antigen ligase family protein [bacterium]
MLCIAVVVVPLLYGGATPLGTLVVRLAALAVFALSFLGRRRLRPRHELNRLLAVLVALALVALLQSLAWPRGLVEALSSGHAQLAGEAAAAIGAEQRTWIALSLNPSASREVALDMLVLGALAFGAARVGRRRSGRRLLAAAVLASASVQIVLGLRPWLSGQVPRLRGSYLNPDHLCVLLEMAACIALAAVLRAVLSQRRFRSWETRAIAVVVFSTLLLLVLAAIAFTGSRAALVAVLVGLLVQLTILPRGRRLVPVAIAAAVGVVSLGYLSWIGVGPAFGRLTGTSWFEVVSSSRLTVWRSAIDLAREFPLVGTGLGSFDAAFPLVQPSNVEAVRWAKAHNDFLELVVTAGLLGLALAAAGVGSLLLTLVRRMRAALRTDDRLTYSTALSCLAAVAVHETVDFGLSLPANAFVLTAILAAAIGARARSTRSTRPNQ